MKRIDTDIFISGGGIAGLTAAAALGRLGLSVILADPAPPPIAAEDDGSDLRSTAFLQPARALLERAGLWDQLAPHSTPLNALRVADCAGDPPEIHTTRTFLPDDLGEETFGWNVPNWLSRKVLTEALSGMKTVDLRLGTGFQAILTREAHAIVTLSDDTQIQTRLAVGADGHASPLREAAGITAHTTRYGQKALAFVVTHETPHENTSTELYLQGGAFTTVPLPDHQGQPTSAIVWMSDGPDALHLIEMDAADFSIAATTRSCGILGDMTLASPRRIWPVITQRASHLTAQRTALIAEAAHVLPPIGAQGLNTSLADVAALVDLAEKHPETIGTPNWLAQFALKRDADIRARVTAIDLYNRVCKSGDPLIQELRSFGLKLAHDVKPLRQTLMRAGIGR